jgi:hypothetical protein
MPKLDQLIVNDTHERIEIQKIRQPRCRFENDMRHGGLLAAAATAIAMRERTDLLVQPIAQDGLTPIAALRCRHGRTFSPTVRSFNAALEQGIKRLVR